MYWCAVVSSYYRVHLTVSIHPSLYCLPNCCRLVQTSSNALLCSIRMSSFNSILLLFNTTTTSCNTKVHTLVVVPDLFHSNPLIMIVVCHRPPHNGMMILRMIPLRFHSFGFCFGTWVVAKINKYSGTELSITQEIVRIVRDPFHN